jgi:hypothetical protein
MKSQGSTSAKITRTRTLSNGSTLEDRYLELQRLRDEVRRAELRCAPKNPLNGKPIYSPLTRDDRPSVRL